MGPTIRIAVAWITLTAWAVQAVMFAACALAFSGMWLLFDPPVDGAEWGWLGLRGAVFAALFIGSSLLYERRRD
ncbi:hypothetical protein [Nocardia sp. XZ_19_385]|uniref:hypothetical protein n=1 Tax=Nocardia sp. XZ_19_385 TaxID=2769488 RepID=UPI00188F64B4|nr:hypothetical protein [Nocardia sp. XZ_19_385]